MLNANPNSQDYFFLEPSSKVEYALLALIEMACHPARFAPLTISEIVTKQPIPARYLEQVFTSLRRSGLVHSHRGSKGGYVLSREPWQITLLDVVASLEGERKDKKQPDTSTLERDVLYKIWYQANDASHRVLSRYTIQDLCQLRDERRQQNPMYYI